MIQLNLLPLIMVYKLNDTAFFLKSHQNPTDSFDVLMYGAFSSSSPRSTKGRKLIHSYARNNRAHHFYFRRLAYLWNVLPPFDESSSLLTIMSYLNKYCGINLSQLLIPCTDTYIYHLMCPCNRSVHCHSFNKKTH